MPLIVIEGLDGSGKATNAAMLEQKLKQSLWENSSQNMKIVSSFMMLKVIKEFFI